jgi:hypothetical protein
MHSSFAQITNERQLMDIVTLFSLKRSPESSASREIHTELLFNGVATGTNIPGYVLEAQYHCRQLYIFVTSWDVPFEDYLTIVLLNEDLVIIDKKSVGAAMYTNTWLESHEAMSDSQLLLRCDNKLLIRVTVNRCKLLLHQKYGGLPEFVPYL